MAKRFSLFDVVRFVATEWGCYIVVALVSVLLKTVLPVLIGTIPGPVDLYWIAQTPIYAIKFGAYLALLLLPLDIAMRWAMTPFSSYWRQVIPLAVCVTAFEVWDKNRQVWPGGDERVVISIIAVAIAGLVAGHLRAWIRRPTLSARELETIFR